MNAFCTTSSRTHLKNAIYLNCVLKCRCCGREFIDLIEFINDTKANVAVYNCPCCKEPFAYIDILKKGVDQ